MPLSTEYDVRTRYRVDAEGARRDVRKMAGDTDKLGDTADRTKSRLGGLFKMAAGALAGGAAIGVGLIGRKLLQVGNDAEQAKIQIAGVFQTMSGDVGNFNAHLDRAGDLFERFSKASISSPATSDQFKQLFGQAAPSLSALGLDNEEITKFIGRSVPATEAFVGGDYDQGGRDLSQILQGRAGADVQMFSKMKPRLLEAMGVGSTEEFNKRAKANSRAAYDALMKVLGGMDAVNDAFGNSVGGMFASIKEQTNQFFKRAAKPVFAALGDLLKDSIEWLDENEERVKSWAQAFGGGLARSIKFVARLIEGAAENADALAAGLTVAAGVTFRHAGSDLMNMARGIPGKGGGGPAAGARRGKGFTAQFANTKGGVASIFASAATPIAASAVALAGLAVAAVAVKEAFTILAKETDELTKAEAESRGYFEASLDWLGDSLSRLGELLGIVGEESGNVSILGQAALYLGGVFSSAGAMIVDAAVVLLSYVKLVGIGLLSIIEEISNFIPGVDVSHVWATESDKTFARINEIINGTSGDDSSSPPPAPSSPGRGPYSDDYINEAGRGGFMFDQTMPYALSPQDKLSAKAKGEAAKSNNKEGQGGGGVNVKVEVNQDIKTDANPDRIALSVGDIVGDTIRKHRKSINPVGL